VTILRSGSSTFARAAAPSKPYGQAARLNLHAASPVGTEEFVYLQFGSAEGLTQGRHRHVGASAGAAGRGVVAGWRADVDEATHR
jgi:hypothetical protein